ncbi:MAG: glycosyltransferase family 87 protein [Promethearchaeota archaeon]
MSEDKKYPIISVFIYIIIGITIILTELRIIFYFTDINVFSVLRDVDYGIFYSESQLGIIEIHKPGSGTFYLYYFYLMFFPFSIIPKDIGVYIWDLARLLSTIYIFKNVEKISEDRKNIVVFLILSTLGYFADAYLNNSNWIVLLLLYLSYIELEKDRKWISGILFALTVFKLTPIMFPIILLIVKKIKLKDLIYFFIPLTLLCLPYIIFPEYFFNFLFNLTIIRGVDPATVSDFIKFLRIMAKAFQTAQLIFYGFIVLVLIENIKDPKRRRIFRIILLSLLLFLGSLAPLLAMLIFG